MLEHVLYNYRPRLRIESFMLLCVFHSNSYRDSSRFFLKDRVVFDEDLSNRRKVISGRGMSGTDWTQVLQGATPFRQAA